MTPKPTPSQAPPFQYGWKVISDGHAVLSLTAPSRAEILATMNATLPNAEGLLSYMEQAALAHRFVTIHLGEQLFFVRQVKPYQEAPE